MKFLSLASFVSAYPRGFVLFLVLVSFSAAVSAQATPGFLPFIDYPADSATRIQNIVVQPDGRILISGVFSQINGMPRVSFARLYANGSIDPSFSPARSGTIALQPDGKIVVAGPTVSRLNADGSLDASFTPIEITKTGGSPAVVAAIAIEPGGKIYVGGNFDQVGGTTQRDVARLNADGTLDSSFADTAPSNSLSQQEAKVEAMAVQADGRLLVGGYFTGIAGASRISLARLNSNGTNDNTFVHTGAIGQSVNQIIIQPDGRIFLSGFILFGGATPQGDRVRLVRLNTDGSLDGAFFPAVNVVGSGPCAIQADGKFICGLGGGAESGGSDALGFLAYRLNSENGAIDNSFSAPRVFDRPLVIAIQPNGKILAGGYFGGIKPRRLARLNAEGSVDGPRFTNFDYDGDLKADVSVFRPSDGVWHISGSLVGYFTRNWGNAADKIIPADFDGDAKTDLAVFRPSNGTWWVLYSADNTLGMLQWGVDGDVALPSDYNGDRKADFMIYRPSAALWYLKSSIDFAESVQSYGTVGDKPLTGDFDGDFLTDYTVFQPADSRWKIRLSSALPGQPVYERVWGQPGDKLAPASYDSDGSTDLGVYRPSTGEWLVVPLIYPFSTNSQVWGTAEDEPAAADFDGDGRADRAVFRPSNNTWYIAGSTFGIRIQHFGAAGDIPAPSAFR